MKDKAKANLIVFFIIAIIAFSISSTFASLTVDKDTESYKLISIENDSFEPNYINKVPTILPKVEKNYTNNNTTDIKTNYTEIEETTDSWNTTTTEWYENTEEYLEFD